MDGIPIQEIETESLDLSPRICIILGFCRDWREGGEEVRAEWNTYRVEGQTADAGTEPRRRLILRISLLRD